MGPQNERVHPGGAGDESAETGVAVEQYRDPTNGPRACDRSGRCPPGWSRVMPGHPRRRFAPPPCGRDRSKGCRLVHSPRPPVTSDIRRHRWPGRQRPGPGASHVHGRTGAPAARRSGTNFTDAGDHHRYRPRGTCASSPADGDPGKDEPPGARPPPRSPGCIGPCRARRDVVPADGDGPVSAVAVPLVRRKLKRLPIVDEAGRLVAVLLRLDLLRAAAPDLSARHGSPRSSCCHLWRS